MSNLLDYEDVFCLSPEQAYFEELKYKIENLESQVSDFEDYMGQILDYTNDIISELYSTSDRLDKIKIADALEGIMKIYDPKFYSRIPEMNIKRALPL